MSAAFDTLSALRNLEASGIDSRHAEAIVQVVTDNHLQLATKADHAALKDDFQAFRKEMNMQFTAFTEEIDKRFAAAKKETNAQFAAWKNEHESSLAMLLQQFRSELWSVVNRMLLAQVAVGGLVVAVLSLF